MPYERALTPLRPFRPILAHRRGLSGTAIFDPQTGRYEGGSTIWDLYCNSAAGQFLSPQTCAIPTITQQAQEQQTALASTQLTPENQAAALAAANQLVSEACAADPADCAAQNAAGTSPIASSLFGPNVTAFFEGIHGTPSGACDPSQVTLMDPTTWCGSTWAIVGIAAAMGLIILLKGSGR